MRRGRIRGCPLRIRTAKSAVRSYGPTATCFRAATGLSQLDMLVLWTGAIYQGHQGGETEPGLSVTRRKMTLLSREPTPKEAQRGFVGPVGHVHSQRRKNRATERGVTDGPLEGASGGCSGANALAWECNIQLGHQPPAALTPLRWYHPSKPVIS